jgi:hypothetical protein
VRIRDGGVTGWHNDIKGASALAVAGSRVALPGGEPIPAGTQIIGRTWPRSFTSMPCALAHSLLECITIG